MKKYQVDAVDFDGKKFSDRYNLDPRHDFEAIYEGGDMFVTIADGINPPDDPPIFEAPDTAKTDRLAALNAKLKSGDLTTAEVSDLLRLERNL